MRSAEASLVEYADRFATGATQGGKTPGTGSTLPSARLEVFDTEIPRSAVPIKGAKKCVFECKSREEAKNDDGDRLFVHGVKAIPEDGAGPTPYEGAPLVLLHGYGNGALYFYRNLLGLSDFYGTVYALDMLGWGLSSRPPFKTPEDTIEAAESFFVESLEEWRKANNLEKITLGGHSMGGYVSVAYCERYPERVDRLILLSPAGVPDFKPDPEMRKGLPLRMRLMIGMASSLFERGTTPGSVLRTLPESRGRAMVRRYVEGRLPAISSPDEQLALMEYFYTNFVLPGSGEKCLNRILGPMAQGRSPTVFRIPKLDVEEVAFIYGQLDWMDPMGGIDVKLACDKLRKDGKKAPRVEVYGVGNAGHLLMLENWRGFNAALIAAGGGAIPVDSTTPFQFREDGPEFFQPLQWQQEEEKSKKFEFNPDEADPIKS